MAPNQRHPGKALVGGYVPQELKDALRAQAAEKGISETAAIIQAVEQWLNAEKRPPADAEGRS